MDMSGDDKPVTRGELREELAATSGELREELRKGLAATSGELRKELAATRDDLRGEIAGTRADIARLDSKTDKMCIEIVKLRALMEQKHEQILSVMGRFRDELTRSYEDSVSKGKMFVDKALTHGDMLSGHELRLADHERRISAMESPPQV